jgi:hypothetical protein
MAYGMPGFGGGMFPPTDPFGVPDYMGGINSALGQNAAMGQQAPQGSPKKGFGEFLRNFAGIYGDNLTGNPAYSQHMKAMQEQEQLQQWYERKRQDEMSDYRGRKEIDAEYSGPDYDADIREYQQLKQLGYVPQDMSYEGFARMKNPGQFVPPSPVRMEPGDVVEGSSDVTATNPQTGEKIRLNPNTGQWEAVGGPSSQGSGGFP